MTTSQTALSGGSKPMQDMTVARTSVSPETVTHALQRSDIRPSALALLRARAFSRSPSLLRCRFGHCPAGGGAHPAAAPRPGGPQPRPPPGTRLRGYAGSGGRPPSTHCDPGPSCARPSPDPATPQISKAVMAVPAKFDGAQRAATVEAYRQVAPTPNFFFMSPPLRLRQSSTKF